MQREEFKRRQPPAAKRYRARLGRCGRFTASKDCLYYAEHAGHTLTCSTLKVQPRRRPAWSGGGGVARERCVRRKLERYSGPCNILHHFTPFYATSRLVKVGPFTPCKLPFHSLLRTISQVIRPHPHQVHTYRRHQMRNGLLSGTRWRSNRNCD